MPVHQCPSCEIVLTREEAQQEVCPVCKESLSGPVSPGPADHVPEAAQGSGRTALECPRCRIINLPRAQRCDCGYDFFTGTVEEAYFRQGFPTGLKTSLIVIALWNLALGVLVFLPAFLTLPPKLIAPLNEIAGLFGLRVGTPITMLVALCWAGLMWVLYALVVRKHYWAYVALIVITFPIGLALTDTREVRLFCLQKK